MTQEDKNITMNGKPKYIKDAVYWNGRTNSWMRISDLNLINYRGKEYYTPAVPASQALFILREAYPYEDWMEEYIGAGDKNLKDLKTKKDLLEFLDSVWHLGDKADFSRWQKADCSDWVNWVEKQGKQEQKQWKPSQEQLDALDKAVIKACSHTYGVYLQDLEMDLRRLCQS